MHKHRLFLICFCLWAVIPQTGLLAQKPVLRDIAIVDFENASDNPELAQYAKLIPEILPTKHDFDQKLSLVDRSYLADVLDEIALGEDGFFAVGTAAQLGKAAGAQHIFVGRLSQAAKGSAVVITTRLIQVESSRIVGTWSVQTGERQLKDDPSHIAAQLARKILKKLFPDSPLTAAGKSAVIPSFGQFSNGRSTAGTLALAGTLGAVGGYVITQRSMSDAKKTLDDMNRLAKTQFSGDAPLDPAELSRLADDYDAAKADRDTKRNRRNAARIIVGVVWGLNLIDAYVGNARLVNARKAAVERLRRDVTVSPTGDFEGVVVRVRF
jgi:TolB-like protein